jgi:Flp pilus assembly protein TadG
MIVSKRIPTARKRKGAAVIETAFVLIVTLLFLFGIVEYGRYTMFRQIIENAAREGARVALVQSGNSNTTAVVAAVRNQVDKFLPAPAKNQLYDIANPVNGWQTDNGSAATDLANANVAVFCAQPNGNFQLYTDPNANPPRTGQVTEAHFGDNVAVQVQAKYRPIFPSLFFGGGQFLTFRARVMMFSESNGG